MTNQIERLNHQMPLTDAMKMARIQQSPPPRRQSVLIVDDHPLMRQVLRELIEAEADLYVIGEANNGAVAAEQFRSLRPDVTLMDLQMSSFDGFLGIEHIRSIEPAARIVVLTSFAGDARVQRAIAAGATGYVLKTASGAEVIGAIRDVFSTRPGMGNAAVATQSAPSSVSAAPTELKLRELSVLREIANGKSNHAIGKALHVSEETVKTRIKKILQKLGAEDRAHAVAIAARRGYLDCLGP